MVVLLEVIAFRLRAVSADGTDIDHAGAIFNEGASLDGNVDASHILQAEVQETFELILPQEILD